MTGRQPKDARFVVENKSSDGKPCWLTPRGTWTQCLANAAVWRQRPEAAARHVELKDDSTFKSTEVVLHPKDRKPESASAWAGRQPAADLGPSKLEQNIAAQAAAPKCEGCDGSGVRRNSTVRSGPMPLGFIAVERCDLCRKFVSDLDAARSIGEARERKDDSICKPRSGGAA